jgi:predicted PurR-regulated permease PerM
MRQQIKPERVSRAAFFGSLLLILWLAYRIAEPFFVEIGWALVLATCLDPVRVRLGRRLSPTRSALVLTLMVVVLLVIPVVLVGGMVINEGTMAADYLDQQLRSKGGSSAWLHEVWQWLREKAPVLPPAEEAIGRFTARFGEVAEIMAARAGGVLKGLASFLFSLTITLVVLFFLLRDWVSISRSFRRSLPFGAEQNERFLTIARTLVSASVTATLLIAAVQGVIGGVTFALLSIPGAAMWGVMIALLALLPMMGATLVWLPAGVWLLLSGSVGKGIVLLLVGIGVLGNVDNVVRPLMLSGSSKVSTPVVIISLLGGLSAFGFIGIVLGPLVAALLTALVETYLVPPPPPEPSPGEGKVAG